MPTATGMCERATQEIDITGEICPMTFVRTKLKLERMEPGELLAVRLNGGEPLTNVPRAAREHGHEVLETATLPDGTHRLLIRRG
jgi:tRNA 2-thiouridine synthesizing protein A